MLNFNKAQGRPAESSNGRHITLSAAELAVFRTRVCEAHRQGICRDADRCARSHCQTWQRRNPSDYVYSSKLCPEIEFVKRGNKMTLVRRCGRGRACMFAHSKEEELYHPSVYKTKMCNAHPNCSRCYCPFAHSSEELRPVPRNATAAAAAAVFLAENHSTAGLTSTSTSSIHLEEQRTTVCSPGSPMSASTCASTVASPLVGGVPVAAKNATNGASLGMGKQFSLLGLAAPAAAPNSSANSAFATRPVFHQFRAGLKNGDFPAALNVPFYPQAPYGAVSCASPAKNCDGKPAPPDGMWDNPVLTQLEARRDSSFKPADTVPKKVHAQSFAGMSTSAESFSEKAAANGADAHQVYEKFLSGLFRKCEEGATLLERGGKFRGFPTGACPQASVGSTVVTSVSPSSSSAESSPRKARSGSYSNGSSSSSSTLNFRPRGGCTKPSEEQYVLPQQEVRFSGKREGKRLNFHQGNRSRVGAMNAGFSAEMYGTKAGRPVIDWGSSGGDTSSDGENPPVDEAKQSALRPTTGVLISPGCTSAQSSPRSTRASSGEYFSAEAPAAPGYSSVTGPPPTAFPEVIGGDAAGMDDAFFNLSNIVTTLLKLPRDSGFKGDPHSQELYGLGSNGGRCRQSSKSTAAAAAPVSTAEAGDWLQQLLMTSALATSDEQAARPRQTASLQPFPQPAHSASVFAVKETAPPAHQAFESSVPLEFRDWGPMPPSSFTRGKGSSVDCGGNGQQLGPATMATAAAMLRAQPAAAETVGTAQSDAFARWFHDAMFTGSLAQKMNGTAADANLTSWKSEQEKDWRMSNLVMSGFSEEHGFSHSLEQLIGKDQGGGLYKGAGSKADVFWAETVAQKPMAGPSPGEEAAVAQLYYQALQSAAMANGIQF